MLKRIIKRIFAFSASLLILSEIPISASAKSICKAQNAEKKIALTFDDGPSSKNIDKILDILDKYNIKATFFVLGEKVKENPDKLKLIHEKGHEIANHSYSHIYINKVSEEKLKKEILDTEKIIYDTIGEKPKLFRPPGGLQSEPRIKMIEDMGYKCVIWSVDSRDWSIPQYQSMVSQVKKASGDGDILLFHDLQSKGIKTAEAIDEIIPYLIDKGYEFVTCSELLENETI